VCNTWAHLLECLSLVVLPGIEGLLWGRIYAMMSQHNQSRRWVLGALSLLLYMGSLGTAVVCMLPFSSASLSLILKHNTVLQFIAVKINATSQVRMRPL
ncbi:hypothetical protein JB92DRAFT_3064838, partial [Gautieria morchelliformis]